MAELTEVNFPVPEPVDPNDDVIQRAAAAPAPAADGDRPAWLPEKFADPQALFEAYSALEARQGTVDPSTNPAQIAKIEVPAEPAPAVFDTQKYTTEMISEGELSEASIAELKKVGIPDSMIATHIAGLEAIRDRQVDKLNSIAGGEEQWGVMSSWATNNLTGPEVDALNGAFASGDAGQTELAMQGLRARFEARTGGDVVEGSASAATSTGFKSTAEMTAAMNDPRYAKDESFRNDVMRKAASMQM